MYPHTFKDQFIRAYNEFAKIKESNTEKGQSLFALISIIEAEISDLRKAKNIGNIDHNSFITQVEPLLKELDIAKFNLAVDIGHVINGKRIPLKITYFNEELLTIVLEKVMVNGSNLLFQFKNGVSINLFIYFFLAD